MGHNVDSTLGSCIHDLRLSWKQLAITDIVYKLIAFVVLTPLVGILFRVFLAISGRSVLADQDILFFLLGPAGWVTLLVVGAVWIAIIALEQAALMTIVCGAAQDRRIRIRSALHFTARQACPILQVTVRMVALALLAAAPLLIAAGAVYLVFLTKYDINYYLSEKPAAFWIAGALLGGIFSALVAAIGYLLSCWAFALPLLLFENVAPHEALRISRERTAGHRLAVALWVAGWFVATAILAAVGTGAVGLVGRLVVPLATGSLTTLVMTVGAMLVLWGGVNFAVTLLTTTAFSVLLVSLYRNLGRRGGPELTPLVAVDSPATGAVFRLRRRTVLAGTAVAVLLAAIMGVAAVKSVRLEDHVEITAHRGASGAAPENTLAAVERAIADEADWVEIDVQESADGVVLVVHDSDLMKLAGTDLKIWETAAEDLRKVDIGSSFGPEFAGERVPTLDEVLRTCKGRVGLNIELKYYGHDQRLEQRVVELVEAHKMQSDIVIMSLEHNAIRKVRSLRPEWKCGLLSAVAVGDLTTLDADFLAVNVGIAIRSFVQSAHRNGKEVHVWTVNDPVTMSAVIGRGADNIITDDPALARTVLLQRAGMSPVERLLVELAMLFGVSTEVDLTADDA